MNQRIIKKGGISEKHGTWRPLKASTTSVLWFTTPSKEREREKERYLHYILANRLRKIEEYLELVSSSKSGE